MIINISHVINKTLEGECLLFANNIHYVGKTFAICPRPPILVCILKQW